MALKKKNPKIKKIDEAEGNPSFSKEFISEMPILNDTVSPGFGKPQDIAKGGFIDMTKDKKYYKGML